MEFALGIAQAYGGHLGGPLVIWTALAVLALASVIFRLRNGKRASTQKVLALSSVLWMIHGVIIWYTTVQLVNFFLYTQLHNSKAEWKQQLIIMVDGCLRFAIASTVALLLATIFSILGALRNTEVKTEMQD